MLKELSDLHEVPVGSLSFIAEPATRPDGYGIAFFFNTEDPSDPCVIAALTEGETLRATTTYRYAAIERIGDGDFKRGLSVLGRSWHKASIQDLSDIDEFPFAAEAD